MDNAVRASKREEREMRWKKQWAAREEEEESTEKETD
jgi:hypothetical protein